MSVPIDQRKWNDIPAVNNVIKGAASWRVSKIMTKMSRHHGHLREDAWAIDWNSLLPKFCRDLEKENSGRWSNKEWLCLLQQGSDKKRFQCCLDSDGLVIYLCAIQGHSGGTMVNLALLDNVEKFHMDGASTSTTSVAPGWCILFFNRNWLQVVKVQEDGKRYCLHLWIPWAMCLTRSTKICWDHERYNTNPSGK